MNDPETAVRVTAAGAQVIADVLRSKHALRDVLPDARREFSTRDGALLQSICYGTARYYPRLVVLLDTLLNKPSRHMSKPVRCLLLSGLYRLYDMRAPDHAVVDLSVRAARGLGQSWACSLVNAVLRNFLRQKDILSRQLMANPVYRYAHPPEFIDKVCTEWPEDWQDILAAGNEQPPIHLRVNHRRLGRDDYLDELASSHVEAEPLPYCPEGVRLAHPLPVESIPGFNDGVVSVQDGAAQQVAHWMDCVPGQRVLDACAAPGGKAAHLLEITDGIELTCLDQSKTRLTRASADFVRLGIDELAVWRQGDARCPESWWDGEPFDHILVDAPCSATGIIRRQPDIKMKSVMERLMDICMTQQEILHALWPLVKYTGRLSYVTCSVLADENDKQMDTFLDRWPDARAIDEWRWARRLNHGRQTLPGTYAMDGFYYARLVKESP